MSEVWRHRRGARRRAISAFSLMSIPHRRSHSQFCLRLIQVLCAGPIGELTFICGAFGKPLVKEFCPHCVPGSVQGRRREEVSPWRPQAWRYAHGREWRDGRRNECDLRLVRRSNGKPLHQERRSGATCQEGDHEAARSLEGWSGRLGAFLPF
jgi:hypothetical protein